MKTFLIIITTIILTIVLEVALLFGYIWFKDPFGIKAFVFPSSQSVEVGGVTQSTSQGLLSPQQETALKNLGIDVSAIPSTIPLDVEECLVEKLGEKRANEIKAGAVPNALDILKGKSCLQ